MERNEVIAVTLLALGVLAIANPVYTGVTENAEGDLLVTASSVDVDSLEFADMAEQLPSLQYIPDLVPVRYEQLTEEDREIVDEALGDGYQADSDEQDELTEFLERALVIIQDGTMYQASVDEESGTVEYMDVSDQVVVVDRDNRTEAEEEALSGALENDSAAVEGNATTLLGYDYVRDGEDYLALDFDEGDNETTLSVERESLDDVLLSVEGVGELDDVPSSVRDDVETAIGGEEVRVDPDMSSNLERVRLIRHDGEYYQVAAEQSEPLATEVLGPANYVGMAAGLLLIVASGLYARRVYREAS
ncbi:MAG: hypothetical protein ACOCT0_03330 [Halobacteriota archaeon]